MTIEQMRTIGTRAAAICDASLYGDPKLENGVWTVGFKQRKEIMALQVNFPDREIAKETLNKHHF
jgi:hypothetical protein